MPKAAWGVLGTVVLGILTAPYVVQTVKAGTHRNFQKEIANIQSQLPIQLSPEITIFAVEGDDAGQVFSVYAQFTDQMTFKNSQSNQPKLRAHIESRLAKTRSLTLFQRFDVDVKYRFYSPDRSDSFSIEFDTDAIPRS